jgi:hypothetical protein
MKLLARYFSLIAVALGLTAASALADSFTYSYTFDGNFSPVYYGAGQTVSGTFDGSASGNLITGITNATVNLDGIPLITGTVYASGIVSGAWTDGAAVVSFDGTQNNFAFFDTDFAALNSPLMEYFYAIGGAPLWPGRSYYELYNYAGLVGAPSKVYADDYDPANGYNTPDGTWTVTKISSVPDSASTLALLASALFGLAAIRRRFAR